MPSDLTHPEAVAAGVPDDCKILALLHDAVEDGHVSLEDAKASLTQVDGWALELLTREKGVSYAAYIEAMAMEAPAWRVGPKTALAQRKARTVKLADLHHNMFGRPKPPNGSLKARYERAIEKLEEAEKRDG